MSKSNNGDAPAAASISCGVDPPPVAGRRGRSSESGTRAATLVTSAKRQSGEIVKENGTTPPSGDDTVALARLVVDLLGRCQLYGQADALRDTAARLLTILVDTEANQ